MFRFNIERHISNFYGSHKEYYDLHGCVELGDSDSNNLNTVQELLERV